MTKLTRKVKNLKTPKRSGNTLSTSWTVPAECKKSGAKDDVRFEGLSMEWVAYVTDEAKKGGTLGPIGKFKTVSADSTGKESKQNDSQNLTRSKYHPNTGKPYLQGITFRIRGYNTQSGKRVYGEWVEKTLAFDKPAAPKLTITFDGETGKVTPKYETTHPDGKKEVYDTQVWVTAGTQKLYDGTAYTDAEKTLTAVEVTGSRTLGQGKFIKVTMKARNRGLAGDSAKAEKSIYICCPNPPSVTDAVKRGTDDSTAQVLVSINPNSPKNKDGGYIRPTTIKLQALVDSTTEDDAASAASSQGWDDVATDDGNTEGLTVAYVNVDSEAGKYTWFRAVAIRDGYTVTGKPYQAKRLNVTQSSTVAGAASIDSLTSSGDGHSAIATLSGKQENDEGYEVSWSKSLDAWESTEPPETFETTGSTLVIKGLDENVRYYAKARAYDLDSEGNHIYGDYSGVKDVVPASTPATVALSAPNVVARGDVIPFTWTFDSEVQQEAATLITDLGKWNAEGSSCAYSVTPDQYGSASSITATVTMTTGGGWADSNEVTVQIADAPTCALSNPAATVAAQGQSFTVQSDKGGQVRVAVYANGCEGTGLHGDREQFDGDTVYSGVQTPSWSGTPRAGSITLPSDLVLYNGADYTLTVVAVDESTGLESEPASSVFTISWSRTASQPTATTTVDADEKSVTVTVAAPSGADNNDTFDLYRVTPDGERKIAEGLPFGSSVKDRFAPYTSSGTGLHYMAVHRTTDGDTCESGDIAYSLASKMLRFDWDGASVELPYNLKLSDSFAKDSEVRKHLDGTSQAYWNKGGTRKATFDTDLIKLVDVEQQTLLRDMFQHPGSVFVRTPDGLAFCADVQPGQIQRDTSNTVAVSISAVEHDLTDEGRPSDADITRPS